MLLCEISSRICSLAMYRRREQDGARTRLRYIARLQIRELITPL